MPKIRGKLRRLRGQAIVFVYDYSQLLGYLIFLALLVYLRFV